MYMCRNILVYFAVWLSQTSYYYYKNSTTASVIYFSLGLNANHKQNQIIVMHFQFEQLGNLGLDKSICYKTNINQYFPVAE